MRKDDSPQERAMLVLELVSVPQSGAPRDHLACVAECLTLERQSRPTPPKGLWPDWRFERQRTLAAPRRGHQLESQFELGGW